eukprot:TRINITY_DN28872_c0_g1_i2.p1 TRINITY_DN28872_c0_g1~~TRINITY_DN28872_c0_g1_i2.p1  ORF type:complete len:103 (-),score=16.94 TRINITY_DN28872_c0_g1_i2:55-363(-)
MCIRDRDTGGFQLKTDRLFSIVHILLNKERVTAKELADQFEVSTRTIYRDIDSLSMSGIPIYTDKGLSLIHISEPTRPLYISYAVFCLKKKKTKKLISIDQI